MRNFFWQTEHVGVERYSVNNINCARDGYSDLVRVFAEESDEDQISIEKEVQIDSKDLSKSSYADSIICTLYVYRIELNRIINSGQMNYDKFMSLVVNALDSAILAENDFDNHFEQFKRDITAYWEFLTSFSIDQKSSVFQEIQHMDSECMALLAINHAFCFSKLIAKENGKFIRLYGTSCLPQINFPDLNCGRKTEDKKDVTYAKKMTENILNNIAVIEKELFANTRYLPVARDYALETLSKIETLAKKYNKIFTEASEKSAVAELGLFKEGGVVSKDVVDEVQNLYELCGSL